MSSPGRKTKVAFIDSFPDSFLGDVADAGAEVIDLREAAMSGIVRALPDTEILVMNSKIRITKEILVICPRLKMICRAGVGLDHIAVDECEKAGIRMVTTPGANRDSVGEHAVGILLSLLHRIQHSALQVKLGTWERESNRGRELGSLSVGIIGYGNTGSAFASKLSGFGCRIMAFDKFISGFGGNGAEEVSMQKLFDFSDVISLHIPLTEETIGMVNAEWIRKFRKPIVFLNLSRGAIVHAGSLIDALNSGKIQAAGLDVLENENLQSLTEKQTMEFDILTRMENVVITPHIAGWSVESLRNINEMMLGEIRGFLACGPANQ